MSADTGLFYYSEKLGKTQPRVAQFGWKITAAKTVTPLPIGAPTLYGFDAFASQAAIDAFLGTSSEFLLAQYDATSMGTDAFGCLVNMTGQVKSLLWSEAYVLSGANGATVTLHSETPALSVLTSSALECAGAVGASGNLGFKLVVAGLDALTSGLIIFKAAWVAK